MYIQYTALSPKMQQLFKKLLWDFSWIDLFVAMTVGFHFLWLRMRAMISFSSFWTAELVSPAVWGVTMTFSRWGLNRGMRSPSMSMSSPTLKCGFLSACLIRAWVSTIAVRAQLINVALGFMSAIFCAEIMPRVELVSGTRILMMSLVLRSSSSSTNWTPIFSRSLFSGDGSV